ncbi:MAG: hypothetical protein M1822_001553 [Bathelium mastoideum]|nr:MAG: hypothetical protein M1822_001553 [Bathelium mastoideum]
MSDKHVVLITGGNTGLGYEVVKALAASSKPYHVIIGSRSLDNGNEAVLKVQKEVPNTASTFAVIQVDIASDDSIEQAFEQVKAHPGRVDSLINNAGWSPDTQIQQGKLSTRAGWNAGYDVNVAGTQVMTQTFIPLLLASSTPRLMFITSGLSTLAGAANPSYPRYTNPPAGWPKPAGATYIAYRSSKAALNMLMLDWHRILKNDGVKVWSISPGMLATGLGGVGADTLRQMGALEPHVGGEFIRDVVEGERDADSGKVIKKDGIQPW